MICLNQLNHDPIFVNADLIERVLPAHQTVLVLTTGKRIPVRQTLDEVLEAIRLWQRRVRFGSELVEQEVG